MSDVELRIQLATVRAQRDDANLRLRDLQDHVNRLSFELRTIRKLAESIVNATIRGSGK